MVSGMDDEIEYIKRKKLVEYMRRFLERQAEKLESGKDVDIYEKVRPLFDEDAYSYLLSMRKVKPGVADKVLKNILFLLLNGLADIPVNKLALEVLERKVEGYKGKIYVERRGELKEFGKALSDED
jgi:DNA-binding TFAR19-related protein (PDSD5 family)